MPDMYSFIFSISVADRMCRSGAIDLICVDSVSALTPRAEIEVSFFFGSKFFHSRGCQI